MNTATESKYLINCQRGADDLIAGVEIAGAPRSMEFLAAGGKVLA